MTTRELAARVERLRELACRLAQETLLIEKADDPMQRMERLAYLAAIHEAIGGIENARVVLAKALSRLEDDQQ